MLYAFLYSSGSLEILATALNSDHLSDFTAAEGKNDATLVYAVKGFNDMLMYFGIIIILLGVVLIITASNRRRNYYVTNYAAIGLCAGGDIVLSFIAIIMNAHWEQEFRNVDFAAWEAYVNDPILSLSGDYKMSTSTLWFDLGYVVYALVILASVALILNLVWKILLMKGEKKLLNGEQAIKAGEETVEGEAV